MRKYLVSGFLGALVIGAGVFLVQPQQGEAASSETYRQLNLFGDVFERIRNDYVKKPDEKKLIEAAIQGMLTSLDPHSSYLNPKNYKDMQVSTRGQFGGLGIEVTMEKGVIKVVSPIDDTPASRAGIQAGDYITRIDDTPVLGLSLREAVDRMRGKVDTEITLTVVRKGVEKPFEVTLKRAIIKVRSVRERREGDIGYVRITSFSEQTEPGLRRAIDRLNADGPLQGLVLDLRNNPGGLLDQAIAVSDAFLDKGEIVSTRGRRIEDTQRFNARPGDILDGKPLVVLINGGSASASEIVAGALQDHGRAIVMGTRSFGKGSVQTIFPIPGNGAVRLTTALYYTPSGRSIQAKGIEPDIEVKQARIETLDNRPQRSEADLRNHLANGNGEKEVKAGDGKGKEKKADAPQDYQLSRALDLIRGIALYNGFRKG